MSSGGQEIFKGTSAEVPRGKPLGENPKSTGTLQFFSTIVTLPPGQWKVDVGCPGMLGQGHFAVASACEWNDHAIRPMLGAGGLKVYNVVPGCRSDGVFQDGTCAVWIENTFSGNMKVRVTVFATF
jgi:hypothetical protein